MLSSSDIERLIVEKRREIEREKTALGLSPLPQQHVSCIVVYKTPPPVAASLVPHDRDIDFLLRSAQLISCCVLILYAIRTPDGSSVKKHCFCFVKVKY